MTQPTHGHKNIPDEDLVALTVVAAVAAGPILAVVVNGWGSVVDWLLDHHLAVPASADPVLPLPWAGGAGLDLPRTVAAACVLALCAQLGWWLTRRARRARSIREQIR